VYKATDLKYVFSRIAWTPSSKTTNWQFILSHFISAHSAKSTNWLQFSLFICSVHILSLSLLVVADNGAADHLWHSRTRTRWRTGEMSSMCRRQHSGNYRCQSYLTLSHFCNHLSFYFQSSRQSSFCLTVLLFCTFRIM